MILEINATLMQSSKSITLITAVIVNKAYSCDVMYRKQMNSYCRNTKLHVETFEIVMYALYIYALSIYGTYCVSMFSMYLYMTERKGFRPYILLCISGNYTPFYQFYPVSIGFK